MGKLKLAVGGLAAFLTLPFLIQALFWLLHRLFLSTMSSATWFGIEWSMVISLVTLVLTWAAPTWLLVRKQGQARRPQFALTALAALFALPFLIIKLLQVLQVLLYRLFSPARSFPSWLGFVWCWYVLLCEYLLSDMTRYVIVSLAALVLTSTALIWLVVCERRRIWRRGRFYVLLVALASVLAFPLLMRYQPAVEAAPDVEMRVVDKPDLLRGAVKRCQVGAEVRACVYEPLGWADAQTLVYRKWCGGHYTEEGWHPGSPGTPMVYDLDTGRVGVSLTGPSALSYETCNPAVCVAPALAERTYFPPLYYLPGHFEDPIFSPDGRWIAFTARHLYGPEDLLIISKGGSADD